jgi:hypothetical protein
LKNFEAKIKPKTGLVANQMLKISVFFAAWNARSQLIFIRKVRETYYFLIAKRTHIYS